MIPSSLRDQLIALPETRELDLFAALLERRGARVLRAPLVAILDAPDPQPVLHWLREFAAGGYHELVLLTGEGLRRLLSCIDKHDAGLRAPFLAALAQTRKITRGPKPARALREVGLSPDLEALEPTTAGIISTLTPLDLRGHVVGVQLYATEPNLPLQNFLRGAGAEVRTVAPYVYADKSADAAVMELLELGTREAGGHLPFQRAHRRDQGRQFTRAPGGQKNALTAPVACRALPVEECGFFQPVQQCHDAGLVDAQMLAQFNLRDAGVRSDQHQQAEQPGPDVIFANQRGVLAPRAQVRAPQVVAQQTRQATQLHSGAFSALGSVCRQSPRAWRGGSDPLARRNCCHVCSLQPLR